MSKQHIFTFKEPNMDRLHGKLEYLTSKYFITSLNCYITDGQHYAVVIAVNKEKPTL